VLGWACQRTKNARLIRFPAEQGVLACSRAESGTPLVPVGHDLCVFVKGMRPITVLLGEPCACGRGGPASAAAADAPAELVVPGRPGDLSEETFAALERRTAALAELKARSVRFGDRW